MIMVRFGKKEITKKPAKKPRKIWDVNVHNKVISKLIETKTNLSI